MGPQAHFSIKSNTEYEEVSIVCRFPAPSAASNPPARPIPTRRRQHRHNCRQIRGRPATHLASMQTEPLDRTPPRPHQPASPPPPVQTESPTAPPPAKKMQKRRCELELLRYNDDALDSPLFISPPTIQTTPPSPSPVIPSSPSSLQPSTPQPLCYTPPPGRAPLTATPTSSTPPSPPPDPAPAPQSWRLRPSRCGLPSWSSRPIRCSPLSRPRRPSLKNQRQHLHRLRISPCLRLQIPTSTPLQHHRFQSRHLCHLIYHLALLTLIPTGVTIYGSHCFKAKFLKKLLSNINLKKIANP
jgi:hypothetical protein